MSHKHVTSEDPAECGHEHHTAPAELRDPVCGMKVSVIGNALRLRRSEV